MYKLLTQKGQLFAFLLGAISTVIVVGSILSNSNKHLLEAPDAAKRAGEIADTGILNTGLGVVTALLFLTLAITVIFGVLHLATNFKQSIKFIAGFAVLIILFMVLKGTAVHETTGTLVETMKTFNIDEGLSTGISAAIKGTIVMTIIAVGSMIVFEIINIFK
jgi:hypothetical protein